MQKALELVERAVNLDPNNDISLYALGDVQKYLGDLSKVLVIDGAPLDTVERPEDYLSLRVSRFIPRQAQLGPAIKTQNKAV